MFYALTIGTGGKGLDIQKGPMANPRLLWLRHALSRSSMLCSPYLFICSHLPFGRHASLLTSTATINLYYCSEDLHKTCLLTSLNISDFKRKSLYKRKYLRSVTKIMIICPSSYQDPIMVQAKAVTVLLGFMLSFIQ